MEGVLMDYQATKETLVNLGLQVRLVVQAPEGKLVARVFQVLKATTDHAVFKVHEEDQGNLDQLVFQELSEVKEILEDQDNQDSQD